jgi:mannose-6-phosphate isomerase-like protein (cupin superfamily)
MVGGRGDGDCSPSKPGRVEVVADLEHVQINEIDAIEGFDRLSMRRAAAALGVSSFGISIEEFGPGADEYPEHDHDAEGLGGKMFGERTEQLGQEEVYVALRGSGTLVVDGEKYPIDSDHIIRVGPGVVRKILAGPDGLRLLALGGRPGEAYDAGGTL